MNKQFNDSGIVIKFMQQIIHENYNSNVFVNGSYYPHFEMNYGMAHYIAKYLDYKYPVLDALTKTAYQNKRSDTSIVTRSFDEPISIMNYFLCNNKGGKLAFHSVYGEVVEGGVNVYEPVIENTPGEIYTNPTSEEKIYTQIYNLYMMIVDLQSKTDYTVTTTKPLYPQFIIKNDLPLYCYTTTFEDNTYYHINQNMIFNMFSWDTPKEICEIDDIVASYLLGRTITPNSSKEDIYYVQKLMIQNDVIPNGMRGVWCPKGYENTCYDLTSVIIDYQKKYASNFDTSKVLVTGYFDVNTEACIKRELGDTNDGIFAL